MKYDSKLLHAGWDSDADSEGSITVPIYKTTAYQFNNTEHAANLFGLKEFGNIYSRLGNPTVGALEARLTALEDGAMCVALSSGTSAVMYSLINIMSQGDNFVTANQLYGGTYTMFDNILPEYGINAKKVDITDLKAVEEQIDDKTRAIYCETVTNPGLVVADVTALSEIAHKHGIPLIVDATFTTSAIQKSFDFGADIVIHSVTKLLAGHSDVTLGYVAAKDLGLREKIYTFSVTTGMTASPFDCWLAERGLLTFPLRFEKTQATAGALAKMLAQHKGVARVLYPGQASHPDFTRAQAILGQNGCNMVSFELANQTREAAERFTKAADQIAFAPTLGDVGTTLSHPVSSSHRVLSGPEQQKLGISEGFFRVSVGLEDEIALLNVFEHALASV